MELKNIIDKLANFVARNGPEFEHMTKQKQKDNPKFSFLFSGEYYNYYQYRVTTEQSGQFLICHGCTLGMLNSIFFPKSKLGSKKSSKNRNSNSVCPIGGLSIGLLRGVNNCRLP